MDLGTQDLLPPAAMDTDAPFETLPAVETEVPRNQIKVSVEKYVS